MVIGEQFAWAHLGKTGGDATLALFRLFPELITQSDGVATNDKHARFADREKEVAGKQLILNIRRLPAWTLSFAHHRATRGLHPDYKPLPMLSPDEMAASTFADKMLSIFTSQGRFTVTRWFRMEYLKWDFLAFISNLVDLSPEQRQQIYEFPRVNEAHYDRNLDNWFTEEQIHQMYANNPDWARVEENVYSEDETLHVVCRAFEELRAERVGHA